MSTAHTHVKTEISSFSLLYRFLSLTDTFPYTLQSTQQGKISEKRRIGEQERLEKKNLVKKLLHKGSAEKEKMKKKK